MITFDVDWQNDLDMFMIRYEELYMKELSYYGSTFETNTQQIGILIQVGTELSRLEKILINNYYNVFLNSIKEHNLTPDMNLYYLQKIIYYSTDIILRMLELLFENKNKLSREYLEYKNRYMIGLVENFVEKFLNPLENIDSFIIKTNNIFQTSYSINNLKKFVGLNKHKFMNKTNITKLETFAKLINH